MLKMLSLVVLAVVPACAAQTSTSDRESDPELGCGGYTGGDDTVYLRGTADTLIQCANGGFVAMLADGSTVSGRQDQLAGITADRTVAYRIEDTTDTGLRLSGNLAGDWSFDAVDTVTLDHANTACAALPTRSWWTQAVVAPASLEP
jgi:hypothetical protein